MGVGGENRAGEMLVSLGSGKCGATMSWRRELLKGVGRNVGAAGGGRNNKAQPSNVNIAAGFLLAAKSAPPAWCRNISVASLKHAAARRALRAARPKYQSCARRYQGAHENIIIGMRPALCVRAGRRASARSASPASFEPHLGLASCLAFGTCMSHGGALAARVYSAAIKIIIMNRNAGASIISRIIIRKYLVVMKEASGNALADGCVLTLCKVKAAERCA